MSDTQIDAEELRELIEQWRDNSQNSRYEYVNGQVRGLDRAADDLEELIDNNE